MICCSAFCRVNIYGCYRYGLSRLIVKIHFEIVDAEIKKISPSNFLSSFLPTIVLSVLCTTEIFYNCDTKKLVTIGSWTRVLQLCYFPRVKYQIIIIIIIRAVVKYEAIFGIDKTFRF